MTAKRSTSLPWVESLVSDFEAGSARAVAAREAARANAERLRRLIVAGAELFLDDLATQFGQIAKAFGDAPAPLSMRRESAGGVVLITPSCSHVVVRLDSVLAKADGVYVSTQIRHGGGRLYFPFAEREGGSLGLDIHGSIVGAAEAAQLMTEPFLKKLFLQVVP